MDPKVKIKIAFYTVLDDNPEFGRLYRQDKAAPRFDHLMDRTSCSVKDAIVDSFGFAYYEGLEEAITREMFLLMMER